MEIPNTHLFTAYFAEGDSTISYAQDAADTSILGNKNAYADVYEFRDDDGNPLNKTVRPEKDLVTFAIKAADDIEPPPECPRAVAVDLKTGEFAVDGHAFHLHHELLDGPLKDFRLLYYRRPAPFLTSTVKNGTGEEVGAVSGYSLGYVIGWEAQNQKGETVKRFITFTGPQVEVS